MNSGVESAAGLEGSDMSEEHKRYLAELIGTAILVLVGCGAAAIGTHATGATAVNVIAAAFGLAVTGMAYAIGPVSGAHINPAITVAMLAAGRMSVRDAIGYVVAQLIGGVVGAGLLVLIVKGKIGGYDLAALGLGQNGWGEGYLGQYGLGAAILTEFLATFIFATVILGATNPTANTEVAGLIIGLTLFALHFPFINVTGFRSIRPAASARRSSSPARRWRRSGCFS
jgi:aquaporin Z